MSSPNPYESPAIPQIEASPARPAVGQDEYDVPPFRSPALLAMVMNVLLVFFILLAVAGMYVHLQLVWLLDESIPASELDHDAIQAWSAGAWSRYGVDVLLTIVVHIWLMIWMYRCHRNLESLGHRELDSKHIWVILGWFIPVLNLYCPFQVMREIWWRSYPLAENAADSAPASHLVFWWWLLKLTAVLTWYLTYLLNSHLVTWTQQNAADRLTQISWGSDILSVLLGMIIVHRITKWQIARYQLQQESAATAT
jgi:Domain of unknown function (DUF4328)